MSKSNKIMIQVCLCGAGTKKAQAPTVPYTAAELAEQIVGTVEAVIGETAEAAETAVQETAEAAEAVIEGSGSEQDEKRDD